MSNRFRWKRAAARLARGYLFVGAAACLASEASGQASTLLREGWQSTPAGTYVPDVLFRGDAGIWFLGDTVSTECTETPTLNRATVQRSPDGNKVLRLDSEYSATECSDNVWIALDPLSIPVRRDTFISFKETGQLDDPSAWTWPFPCLFPPCGDKIYLMVETNQAVLVYVLQRAENDRPLERPFGLPYLEVFLNSATGVYTRDLFADLSRLPEFNPATARIEAITFSIDMLGWAIIDDISVAVDPNPPRICGNGRRDPGEPCEAGVDKCCTEACQLAAVGTICRPAADSCDTAEECSGTSPECGEDRHRPDGTRCDDGRFCNGSDTCVGGRCASHSGDPCAGGPECADTCIEVLKTCNEFGTPCTDDGNPCTNDWCNGGSCTHPPNDKPCDDGDGCTVEDICSSGSCRGMLRNCDDGNPCTTDLCSSGDCVYSAVLDGTPCSDRFFCNGEETCDRGTCVASSLPCPPGTCLDGPGYNRCAVCGDGVVDPREVCGEPGLPRCPEGQTCTNCGCCGGVVLSPGDILVASQSREGWVGPQTGSVVRVDPVTGDQDLVLLGGLLNLPRDVAMETDGSVVVADRAARAVIRIDPDSCEQTVVSEAENLRAPERVAVEDGGALLVTDPDARAVIRIDPRSGVQAIVSAGGLLSRPWGLAIGSTGEILVGDAGQVVRIDPETGEQTRVCAPVPFPLGLAVNADDEIFTVGGVCAIRECGVRVSCEENLRVTSDLIIDADNHLVVADQSAKVVRIDPATGVQTLLSSGGLLRLPQGIGVVPECGSADRDADGVPDACDNCRETSNPDQADLDWPADDDSSRPGVQHYGDACDADLDNDGIVGASDFFGVFRPCLGRSPGEAPECAPADLDRDGIVGASDFFGALRPALGGAPGPGVTDPS